MTAAVTGRYEPRPEPSRITLALNLRQLYGPEVDLACAAEEPAVDRWEAGEEIPTTEQVELLAGLTDFPVAWFYGPPITLIRPEDIRVCTRRDIEGDDEVPQPYPKKQRELAHRAELPTESVGPLQVPPTGISRSPEIPARPEPSIDRAAWLALLNERFGTSYEYGDAMMTLNSIRTRTGCHELEARGAMWMWVKARRPEHPGDATARTTADTIRAWMPPMGTDARGVPTFDQRPEPRPTDVTELGRCRAHKFVQVRSDRPCPLCARGLP